MLFFFILKWQFPHQYNKQFSAQINEGRISVFCILYFLMKEINVSFFKKKHKKENGHKKVLRLIAIQVVPFNR